MHFDEIKKLREKKGLQVFGLVKKSLAINNLNYMHRYDFYLGQHYTSKRFFYYAVGCKGTLFLKYKKPVHFFQKKKKINVKKSK